MSNGNIMKNYISHIHLGVEEPKKNHILKIEPGNKDYLFIYYRIDNVINKFFLIREKPSFFFSREYSLIVTITPLKDLKFDQIFKFYFIREKPSVFCFLVENNTVSFFIFNKG